MRANETTLRTLLQGEKQYIIPLYQRTYSWKRPQLDRLWSDILELLDTTGTDSHFLGPIVLAPSHNMTASGVQSWLVVDGQQRLTTLSILLAAIRDLASGPSARLARKISTQYLINEFADGINSYTLLPTQADRAAWRAIIDRMPNAGGADKIGDAYRFFRSKIDQLFLDAVGDSEGDEVLEKLEGIVATKLSFVEISAQAGDNAYRIFESLNNTGLKLTQADLLRNYLFMRLPETSERVYEQHWLPLQNLLDEQSLVDLIWLDLVLKGNKRATLHSIYEEQHRFLETLGSEIAIEQWIVALNHKARVFDRVLNPEKESDPIIRYALDRLRRWKARVVHPAALHVLLSYEDGKMNSQEVSDALRAVESYLVRQLIVGTGRAGSNVLLADLIRTLGDKVPRQDQIIKILTGQRRRFPTDQQVRAAMLEQPFYWRGREWQKFYILRCLDEAAGRTEVVDYENSGLSIEHVMPQKATAAWLNELEYDLEEFESAEDAHQALVHAIGNLTLSGYNGSLSNKNFPDKREILAKSGLSMNLSIADSARWGVAEIRQRGEFLANKAIEIWPGPGESHNPAVDRRLASARQVLSLIPAGCWTNLLSLAQAIGTHRRTIGKLLAENELTNSHRVLLRDGSIPAGSVDSQEWLSRLEAEGVKFDARGRANKSQHVDAVELVYPDGSLTE
ncbi:GmrSD restriction endonuclease domain-containing protein [Micromonospora rosaria]|uniref:GmrSD restriction endonuclease domain-containing protein n=1 Tax=Micromonospora rosaria TaxID=47874 RepID=UPI000AFB9B66|nr:DUF262 domain-containing protein [Micromonospora rosaria]